ncbi:hypothetical protein [Streptomyces spinosirectus]
MDDLPADVQSLYYALPDGADFERKRLLVVCRGEDDVVGLVDVVDRFPGGGSCSVGVFLVAPETRHDRGQPDPASGRERPAYGAAEGGGRPMSSVRR